MSTPEQIKKKDERSSSASSSSSSASSSNIGTLPSLRPISSIASASSLAEVVPVLPTTLPALLTPPTEVILRKQYKFCADQKKLTLLFQAIAAKSINIIAETIVKKKTLLVVGATDSDVPAQNLLLEETLKEFKISFDVHTALQVVTPAGSDSTPGVFSRYLTALTTHSIPLEKSYFGAGPTGVAVFFVVPDEYVSAAELVLSMVPQ